MRDIFGIPNRRWYLLSLVAYAVCWAALAVATYAMTELVQGHTHALAAVCAWLLGVSAWKMRRWL